MQVYVASLTKDLDERIPMPKTTIPYWNPLAPESDQSWKPVEGMEGMAEAITLSIDEETGDYSRITRFLPGADTTALGPQVHDYPEEVLIMDGKLYDAAFDCWLTAGDYASRPPCEIHGPFQSETGCTVFEVSFPSQRRV